MAKRRIILVLVVCFSIAVFTSQTLSRARSSNRTVIFPFPKPSELERLVERLNGMTAEEREKEQRKRAFEPLARYWQQDQERSEEHIKLRGREAWKRLLRVTEQRWKPIESKYEKVRALRIEARVKAIGGGGRDDQSFLWRRRSKDVYPWAWGIKALDEQTEGERIAEELIDLLENENTKDLEFRQKIDALQQAREKARKQLPKARQELAEVLTTPRQEAVLLLLGYLD